MTPREQLEDWLRGIQIEIPAHYGAAKMFERYQSCLDWPTIVVTSLTSSAIISTASTSSATTLLTGIAIALSLAAAVLTPLRSFLDYMTRAKAHKTSAVSLSKLRRELEEYLAYTTDDALLTNSERSKQFRTTWDTISENAPTIPDTQYNLHRERLGLAVCSKE